MPNIRILIEGPAKSGKSIIASEIVQLLKRKGVEAVVLDPSVELDGGHLFAIPNLRIEIAESLKR